MTDPTITELFDYLRSSDKDDTTPVFIISGSRERRMDLTRKIETEFRNGRIDTEYWRYYKSEMAFRTDKGVIYLQCISSLYDCYKIWGQRAKLIFTEVGRMPIETFHQLVPVDIHHGHLSHDIAVDLYNLFGKYGISIQEMRSVEDIKDAMAENERAKAEAMAKRPKFEF